MKHLYLEDLDGLTGAQVKAHLVEEYEAEAGSLKKYNVVIAYESVGSWGCDSSSFFLLQHKKTKRFEELHGSHCSCYGFEGQFKPERTTKKYLKSESFDFLCGGYDDNETKNQVAVKEFLRNL